MMGEVTHPRPHVGPKPRFPDGTLGLQNSLLLLVMQKGETLECLPWASPHGQSLGHKASVQMALIQTMPVCDGSGPGVAIPVISCRPHGSLAPGILSTFPGGGS